MQNLQIIVDSQGKVLHNLSGAIKFLILNVYLPIPVGLKLLSRAKTLTLRLFSEFIHPTKDISIYIWLELHAVDSNK